MSNTSKTIDLGNNETTTVGVVAHGGEFFAMTRSASKVFKTKAGALRWLARRGFTEHL